MRIITALLLAGLAPTGCSQPAPPPESETSGSVSPEAAWQDWVEEAEASYAEEPQAVLKVNDAIYIQPGETAWLAGNPDDPATYHWTLARPDDPQALSVAFALPEPDAPQATLTHAGESLPFGAETKTYTLSDDILVYGGPSGLGTDDPRFAVFAYNQRHPAAAAFKGLSFYPYAPHYRIEAAFIPTTPPDPRIMQTERGLVKQFFEVGRARFTLDGAEIDMPLYGYSAETEGIDSLFAPFTDETTGSETYGVGRYMDIALDGETLPDSVTLDFNYAYNPLCARSEHYNCPLVEFTLPTAIRAGERYDYAH